jgi:hypothetical protein
MLKCAERTPTQKDYREDSREEICVRSEYPPDSVGGKTESVADEEKSSGTRLERDGK